MQSRKGGRKQVGVKEHSERQGTTFGHVVVAVTAMAIVGCVVAFAIYRGTPFEFTGPGMSMKTEQSKD